MAQKKLRPPPRNHHEARALEYPPLQEQLEAIWAHITPAVNTPAGQMKTRIMAVQARHPVP